MNFIYNLYNINNIEQLEKLMENNKWEHYKKCLCNGDIKDIEKIYNLTKNKDQIILQKKTFFVHDSLDSCDENEKENQEILE
jgi:hypothetical protein